MLTLIQLVVPKSIHAKEDDQAAKWKSYYFFIKKLTELAWKKRVPEWFALRKFLVTCTVAFSTAVGLDHCKSTQDFFCENVLVSSVKKMIVARLVMKILACNSKVMKNH